MPYFRKSCKHEICNLSFLCLCRLGRVELEIFFLKRSGDRFPTKGRKTMNCANCAKMMKSEGGGFPRPYFAQLNGQRGEPSIGTSRTCGTFRTSAATAARMPRSGTRTNGTRTSGLRGGFGKGGTRTTTGNGDLVCRGQWVECAAGGVGDGDRIGGERVWLSGGGRAVDVFTEK